MKIDLIVSTFGMKQESLLYFDNKGNGVGVVKLRKEEIISVTREN